MARVTESPHARGALALGKDAATQSPSPGSEHSLRCAPIRPHPIRSRSRACQACTGIDVGPADRSLGVGSNVTFPSRCHFVRDGFDRFCLNSKTHETEPNPSTRSRPGASQEGDQRPRSPHPDPRIIPGRGHRDGSAGSEKDETEVRQGEIKIEARGQKKQAEECPPSGAIAENRCPATVRTPVPGCADRGNCPGSRRSTPKRFTGPLILTGSPRHQWAERIGQFRAASPEPCDAMAWVGTPARSAMSRTVFGASSTCCCRPRRHTSRSGSRQEARQCCPGWARRISPSSFSRTPPKTCAALAAGC